MRNRVGGAIARNTIGSAAYWTNKQLDKEKGRMAQSRAGRAALWVASSLGGSGLKDKIEGLGNKSTFGGSMSYQQRREKEWQGTAEAALKAAGNDTDKIADLVTSYDPGRFGRRDKIDYIYSKLTPAQRYQIQQKLTGKDATEAQKKLYADLDKSWKDANKKKAGNEQKEANKFERQAKEEINLEEYNKAVNDFREAEKGADEKKLQKARETLQNSAIKLTKGQVKNDISVEDLMLTAEQKAWGTEQLSGILDERNGTERLNQEQISTLRTTRLEVKEREDKLKESSKKLSQMLTSATATKEDADALVKELGEPTISPIITPTVTVNKNVIRSLKEDVIKTLMRKNFVSFEDQKKIRRAVEKMINSNDPNITDDLLKLNVALEKDPILKNFGKTEEK
jgi:predicted nucleic-acid-binding protein